MTADDVLDEDKKITRRFAGRGHSRPSQTREACALAGLETVLMFCVGRLSFFFCFPAGPAHPLPCSFSFLSLFLSNDVSVWGSELCVLA